MKGFLLILILLVVFSACAFLGYEAANRMDLIQTGGTQQASASGGENFNEGQHNLILVHVDQLAGKQSRLVSVWYVSLTFINDAAPHMDMGRLYPSGATPELAQALQESFTLSPAGDPGRAFWDAIRGGGLRWENFLVVDNVAVQKMLEWINGPGDYPDLLGSRDGNPGLVREVLMQTCGTMSNLESRGEAPFSWGDLAPAHFHSNLNMEVALAYWTRITNKDQPVSCLVP